MPRYVAWIPAWGSVKHVLEIDEKLSGDELKERFEEEAQEKEAGLCHYCARHIEIGDANWEQWDGHVEEDD